MTNPHDSQAVSDPLSPASLGPQPEKIRSMFSTIAGRYDIANTVLSAGIHHLWRKSLVEWSDVQPGMSVLDCATGTGDLAIEFKKAVGGVGRVVGTDFCAEMMVPAPAKAKARGLEIEFAQADVMNLPYADASFDIASISFGIRNVADPVRAMSELGRVVRPGGKVMVLEFGQPQLRAVGALYRFYSNSVLPKIGGLITGQPTAYEYLQKSSSNFPCREDFLKLMGRAGRFQIVAKNVKDESLIAGEYQALSLGIAYMYRAVRI